MNRPLPPQTSHRNGFAATCADLQPGFTRLVLPLLIACAALLLLDCASLRDYLARGPHIELAQAVPIAINPAIPWTAGGLDFQTTDPVTSAKALATLIGLLIFMTASSLFAFDAILRVGAALHRRSPPRPLG
jgi:hypothetical protein